MICPCRAPGKPSSTSRNSADFSYWLSQSTSFRVNGSRDLTCILHMHPCEEVRKEVMTTTTAFIRISLFCSTPTNTPTPPKAKTHHEDQPPHRSTPYCFHRRSRRNLKCKFMQNASGTDFSSELTVQYLALCQRLHLDQHQSPCTAAPTP